jgi:hypothetical protein
MHAANINGQNIATTTTKAIAGSGPPLLLVCPTAEINQFAVAVGAKAVLPIHPLNREYTIVSTAGPPEVQLHRLRWNLRRRGHVLNFIHVLHLFILITIFNKTNNNFFMFLNINC